MRSPAQSALPETGPVELLIDAIDLNAIFIFRSDAQGAISYS
jgi:hypothetical protein